MDTGIFNEADIRKKLKVKGTAEINKLKVNELQTSAMNITSNKEIIFDAETILNFRFSKHNKIDFQVKDLFEVIIFLKFVKKTCGEKLEKCDLRNLLISNRNKFSKIFKKFENKINKIDASINKNVTNEIHKIFEDDRKKNMELISLKEAEFKAKLEKEEKILKEKLKEIEKQKKVLKEKNEKENKIKSQKNKNKNNNNNNPNYNKNKNNKLNKNNYRNFRGNFIGDYNNLNNNIDNQDYNENFDNVDYNQIDNLSIEKDILNSGMNINANFNGFNNKINDNIYGNNEDNEDNEDHLGFLHKKENLNFNKTYIKNIRNIKDIKNINDINNNNTRVDYNLNKFDIDDNNIFNEKLLLSEYDENYQNFLNDPLLSEAISNYYFSMK
jgi:hypothetical protein